VRVPRRDVEAAWGVIRVFVGAARCVVALLFRNIRPPLGLRLVELLFGNAVLVGTVAVDASQSNRRVLHAEFSQMKRRTAGGGHSPPSLSTKGKLHGKGADRHAVIGAPREGKPAAHGAQRHGSRRSTLSGAVGRHPLIGSLMGPKCYPNHICRYAASPGCATVTFRIPLRTSPSSVNCTITRILINRLLSA
jgi:hypothetical protein